MQFDKKKTLIILQLAFKYKSIAMSLCQVYEFWDFLLSIKNFFNKTTARMSNPIACIPMEIFKYSGINNITLNGVIARNTPR